jgi:hypothetical protein
MEINNYEKPEYALVHPVDIEKILILCYIECGYRLMN